MSTHRISDHDNPHIAEKYKQMIESANQPTPDLARLAEAAAKEIINSFGYFVEQQTPKERAALLSAIIARHIEPLAREKSDWNAKANDLALALDVANDHIDDLVAERDRLRAQLREKTQWVCQCGGTDCEGQKENERLRAEVERLTKERDEARAIAASLEKILKQCGEDNAALRAELEQQAAEAMKDRERLDWLNENMTGSFGPAQCSKNPHPIHTWSFEAPVYEDLRAAIDAARQSGEQKKGV